MHGQQNVKILKWNFKKWHGQACSGAASVCESGNKLSVSIKCGEFLD